MDCPALRSYYQHCTDSKDKGNMNLNYFTKTKEVLFLLFCLSLPFLASAQEATKPLKESKQKEIGVVFRDFDNFGLTYRTGTEKSLWRFNTLVIRGGSNEYLNDAFETITNNMGFRLGVGKEWRKEIVKNFELRYGADLAFNYLHSKTERDGQSANNYDFGYFYERTSYGPGVRFVFGFNYVIQDKLVLGAEVLPGFSYYTGQRVEERANSDEYDIKSDISGFSYGLSNSSVLLSALYRF